MKAHFFSDDVCQTKKGELKACKGSNNGTKINKSRKKQKINSRQLSIKKNYNHIHFKILDIISFKIAL